MLDFILIHVSAEVNYVGKVNEFANHYRQRQPCYSDEAPINGTFVIQCTFMNNNTFGYGKTKKAAKQHSAELMWKKYSILITSRFFLIR